MIRWIEYNFIYIYIHDDPSPQCCTKFFYYVMWQGFLELQPLKISLQHSPLKSQNLEPILLYIIYLIINFNKKTRIIPKNLAYINSRATRNNPQKNTRPAKDAFKAAWCVCIGAPAPRNPTPNCGTRTWEQWRSINAVWRQVALFTTSRRRRRTLASKI